MWQLIFTMIFFIAFVCRADDNLFTDSQFEEVPMEYDPDFKDDFVSGLNTNFEPGCIISETYGLFSHRDIFRREKSLSVTGGNETIASTYHLMIYPQGRFEFMKLYGHVGVPLRFPYFDNLTTTTGIRRHGFVAGEKFILPRRGDYRSFFDVQRFIRHLEFSEETEPYFFRLSRINSITLGQGELVRGLTPDGLYDEDLAFLTGHGSFDGGRVYGFLGPLFKAHMLGLSFRYTPLTFLDVPPFVQNLNFELAYVGDFMAPNQTKKQDGAFRLNDEQRLIERDTGTAQGITLGVAGEYFALPWLSLKPYVSVGNLWLSGLKRGSEELLTRYGAGLHVGHDATFHFASHQKSILVFKTEGRLFTKMYWPGYFGGTYMIDRQVINEPENTAISSEPLSKSQYLGQYQDNRGRFGYLFELAYIYDKMISLVLGYENARSFERAKQIDPMRRLQFVMGFVGLDTFKFHIGYQATSPQQMKEVFDFEKSRALLSLRGQLKLAPFLYFDGWAKHSFGINDMFTTKDIEDDDAIWLSHQAETRSFNFGLGLEFAMTF